MIKKFDIQIFVPVLASFFEWDNLKAQFYVDTKLDITKMDKFDIKFFDMPMEVEIQFLEKNIKKTINNENVFLKLKNKLKIWDILHLKVQISFSFREVVKHYKEWPGTKTDLLFWHAKLCAKHIYKKVTDLVLCANIARPGSLEIGKCFILINKKYIEEKDGLHYDYFLIEDYFNKWPFLQELSLANVFEWANSIPDFDYAVSKSPLGRAIGALSYIFLGSNINYENEIKFIWLLIALEAIYSKNKGKLDKKIKDFLGEGPNDNEEKFKKLYKNRSELLHGKMDFVFRNHIYDASDEYERFNDNINDIEQYMLAILLATIQKMVKNNLLTIP